MHGTPYELVQLLEDNILGFKLIRNNQNGGNYIMPHEMKAHLELGENGEKQLVITTFEAEEWDDLLHFFKIRKGASIHQTNARGVTRETEY